MTVFRLRTSTLRATALIAAALLLSAADAAAQYTPQELVAPTNPGSTETRGFAMNNNGQVFGVSLTTSPTVFTPMLWTNGVPAVLPMPAGYIWDTVGGRQFLNDNGTAIGSVAIAAQGVPGGAIFSIIRWRPSGQDFVPMPPPSTLAPQGCTYVHTYPMGLNNHDHVLVVATDVAGSCPSILWIWDGTDNSASSFHEIAAANVGPTPCTPAYLPRFNGNLLNDADHVAINFGPSGGPNATCNPVFPVTAGIIANGIYTAKIPIPLATSNGTGIYGVFGINNADQLLAADDAGTHFWDGTSQVDLGVIRGISMNDFGEVLFSTNVGGTPRIYRHGLTDNVPLPTVPGADTSAPLGGTIAINSAGQLLIPMLFGPQFGTQKYHLVVFTPTPPTITWPKATDISYGTPLGATQLNATATDAATQATVAGQFVYTPPSGTLLDVGDNQALSLTFAPTPLGYARTSADNSITVTRASTSLTSSPSVNPSRFGQSVQFTATLGATPPNAAAATGSVEFFDGVSSLGSSSLVNNNGVLSASLSTSALSVASHSINTEYSGDSHYLGSTAQTISQTVNAALTTTGLNSSPNPSNVGDSVTLTATVAVSSPGAGVPTGSVTFFDGTSSLGSSSLGLVNGNTVATLSTSALTAGTHSLTATYAGTTSFVTSTSASHSQVVNAVSSLTGTAASMTASANPIAAGGSLTLTATVTSTSGAKPSGQVTFFDGTVSLGTATLAQSKGSMRATLSTSALSVGFHVLTAQFVGNATFAPSTSSPLAQTVSSGGKLGGTSSFVATTGTPAPLGVLVIFTATVKASGKTVPTGSVRFYVDGVQVGTASLVGGVKASSTAAIGLNNIARGTHRVIVLYEGSATLASSTSANLIQVIQ